MELMKCTNGLLFPAYAGVILKAMGFDGWWLAFPRVCGGDPEYKVIWGKW